MCSGTDSLLDIIEDLVLNQDEIVTYRWLSRRLNVHVNTAKQLLHKFCSDRRDKVDVTYLIVGKTNDGANEVILCNGGDEEELKRTRSGLKNIGTEHVYSVERRNSAVSSQHLYLVDCDKCWDDETCSQSHSRLGAIASREVERREMRTVAPADDKKSAKLTGKQQNGSTCTITKPAPATKPAQPHPKEPLSTTTNKSPVKIKVQSPIKSQKKVNSKGKTSGPGISAFFNKGATTDTTANKGKDKESSQRQPASSNTELPRLQEDKREVEDNEKDEVVEERMDVAVAQDSEPSPERQLKTPVASRKKRPKAKSNKKNSACVGKRKKRSDDEMESSLKKRKRIVLCSDSEDEEDDEGMDDEEEEDEEPVMERPPPPSCVVDDSDEDLVPPTPVGDKVKKRTRKRVDRTYKDDEGFIITDKVFVYVDEEEEAEESKADDKSPSDESVVKSAMADSSEKTADEDKKTAHTTKKGDVSKGAAGIEKSDQGKKSTANKGGGKRNAQNTSSKQQASIMSFFKKK